MFGFTTAAQVAVGKAEDTYQEAKHWRGSVRRDGRRLTPLDAQDVLRRLRDADAALGAVLQAEQRLAGADLEADGPVVALLTMLLFDKEAFIRRLKRAESKVRRSMEQVETCHKAWSGRVNASSPVCAYGQSPGLLPRRCLVDLTDDAEDLVEVLRQIRVFSHRNQRDMLEAMAWTLRELSTGVRNTGDMMVDCAVTYDRLVKRDPRHKDPRLTKTARKIQSDLGGASADLIQAAYACRHAAMKLL
jgi:hypothetical protein